LSIETQRSKMADALRSQRQSGYMREFRDTL